MPEDIPNPLRELKEAVARSQHLALEMAALQDRITMLARQVELNTESHKRDSKVVPPPKGKG
jgi:hypothetical protein